jgi:recombining binding protein suppressor of hairless
VPSVPITPFPTLFTAPAYRPAPHTIELTVSNFFYQHPETHAHTPLEVWLGGLGPLRQRIFQATPPGPLTSVSPYAIPSGGPISGEAINIAEAGPSGNQHSADTPQTIVAPPRFVPSGPLHTIIIVDLPPLSEIVKSLHDGVMSLAAGAAEAARMMAPSATTRSPPLERDRRTEDGQNGVTSEHRSDADSSSGQPTSLINENSSSHAHASMLENVQGPEHNGPLPGQSLPLLFIRGSDGMGYHSGRSIACDHTFPDLGSVRSPTDGRSPVEGGWIGATEGGWSLRVI